MPSPLRAEMPTVPSGSANRGVLSILLYTVSSVWSGRSGKSRLWVSAAEALSAALDGLRDNLPTDLLSEEIRQVIHHLSGVTGQDIVPEEVLKTIFSKFCIGK